MSRHRAVRLVVCILALAVLSGCGSKSKDATPADRFRSEQRDTVTPYGPIDPDSVRDGSDGTVEFSTSDGKRWRTRMKKRGDGSREWAEPEPAAKTQ